GSLRKKYIFFPVYSDIILVEGRNGPCWGLGYCDCWKTRGRTLRSKLYAAKTSTEIHSALYEVRGKFTRDYIALEKDCRVTCEELSDNACPPISNVVPQKLLPECGWEVLLHAPQSGHESTRVRLVPQVERTYVWTSLSFSGRNLYHRYLSHLTDEQK
ncbi:hypothetical protein C0J52_08079, partial [Blattella germanica]